MANEYNPNNALGTPNKYGGKTSVEGFSDGIANYFSEGIVSGFTVRANSPAAMSVLVGGEADSSDNPIKDVALLADSSADDRYVIFNKSNAEIAVDIPTAPTANSRIDAIVLYRDQVVTGDSDSTDNPSSVGIVVVSGASAASPSNPTEAQIRAALPNGTSALYMVLAYVTVATGVTAISDSNISDARVYSTPIGQGFTNVVQDTLDDAKTYADDGDKTTLSSAKTYASGLTSGTLSDITVVNKTISSVKSGSTTITAPTKSGYKFLCWIGAATSGWVATLYFENYSSSSTKLWGNTSESGTVTVYALLRKNH